MRWLCAFVVCLLPVSAGADTYPRQPGLDVEHYVFRLALDDASDRIVGEATVRARVTAGELREFWLDLASAAGATGMTVRSVTSAGSPVRFAHDANRLHLTLGESMRKNSTVAVTIAYDGVPGSGLKAVVNAHGERTFFSENWPDKARQWLPMVDHPADKATGEFVVTAPAHYQVVANGLLVEERDVPGGMRTTHWRQSVPISSWLYALGVARFSVHHAGSVGGVPLQTWVFPQDREVGLATFEELSRGVMAFFSDRIGPYSYEKLANVQAAGMGGGMEHASAIFYGEKGVAAGRAPVAHEIAHQWFGNAVTERDWDDVWLSEGFATYFALLYTEHADGRDAFTAGLRRTREGMPALEAKTPDTPIIHRNLSDMGKVLNQLVYQKGAWVLHMLRAQIGTDAFWATIRDYYQRYRNQATSTAELRAVAERVSGQSLDWFFTQWLTRPGLPRVDGSWRYDRKTQQLEVTLTQVQETDPYRLSVEIGIVPAPGAVARVERLEMNGRSATTRFAVPAPPSAVTLDPHTWLLAELGTFVEMK